MRLNSIRVARVPSALITGASTGIGRATTLHLAKKGWTVLACVREQAAGERLVAEAGDGARVYPLLLDVTNSEQIAAAARLIQEEQPSVGGPALNGRLDALVNNAGIAVGGPLELIPLEQLRVQLEVNVIGQVGVTQALLPALRRARGRIVFVSSIGGRVAMAFTAPYAASKHALEALGDALRVELRTSGVQVAIIEPGSVSTPIWDKGRESAGSPVPSQLEGEYGHVPAAMDRVLENANRRGVPAEQVAETIARALSARRMKARYIVGSDAWAMLLAKRLLPAHVFDQVARRALGV